MQYGCTALVLLLVTTPPGTVSVCSNLSAPQNQFRFELLPGVCAAIKPLEDSATLRGNMDSVLLKDAGGDGYGHRLWPASLALVAWLRDNPELVRGKTVLELGAGAFGLGSLAASALGAKLAVATDGSMLSVTRLRRTAVANMEIRGGQMPFTALQLRWGSRSDVEDTLDRFDVNGFDLVIGADLLYSAGEIPFQPLAETWWGLAHEHSSLVLVTECRGHLGSGPVFLSEDMIDALQKHGGTQRHANNAKLVGYVGVRPPAHPDLPLKRVRPLFFTNIELETWAERTTELGERVGLARECGLDRHDDPSQDWERNRMEVIGLSLNGFRTPSALEL